MTEAGAVRWAARAGGRTLKAWRTSGLPSIRTG